MIKEEILDLLIIGAGPAGLGAAIYAARSALNFKITEKFMAGGQIVTTEYIENYPGFKGEVSGYDLMQEIIGHCQKFKVSIIENTIIEKITASGKKDKGFKLYKCAGDNAMFLARSVIVATGASPQRLSVEGENQLIGKGISFCATCDGALYYDKEVMVIGGGNTAVQEALFLTKFARKVYLVHRRDELRAVKILQEKILSHPGVEILWDSVVSGFKGGDRIEEAIIKNVKTGKSMVKKIDGVFEYVGIKPNSSLVKGLLELDETGFIVTDANMKSSSPGVFAAGDVRNTVLRQVITAVSDGAIAATSADRYLAT